MQSGKLGVVCGQFQNYKFCCHFNINETFELELYFVFEGELDKHRVLAQGPADAPSLSQLEFHAREAVGQLWGEPSLSLAKSDNGYFALDMFCGSLGILEVSEIETDD